MRLHPTRAARHLATGTPRSSCLIPRLKRELVIVPLTLVESIAAAPWRWSKPRLPRALWHLFLMFVQTDHQVRHGALFVTLTEGDVFERNFNAFRATPLGSKLIKLKPDTGALLADKATLASLPAASFGCSYARYMKAGGLDETYYSGEGRATAERENLGPDRYWFRIRCGTLHDINHLLTGYEATILGEACLMAFRFAQLRHPGLIVLCVLQCMEAKISGEQSVFAPVFEAFRRGWNTKPFELLPWEETLHVSLASHRAWLGLSPPNHYSSSIEPEAYRSNAHDLAGVIAPDDGPAAAALAVS